jgi:hypothetical protein
VNAGGRFGLFPALLLEDRGLIAEGRSKHVVRVAVCPDNPDERLEYEVVEDVIVLDVPERSG